MKIDLSIIIINFNTLNLTVDCIRSIKKNTKNINFEIIIIDNYPQANGQKKLKRIFQEEKNIKIISSKNYGFGTANNLGAKKARGEYLLILNSDTKIIDDSIEKMIIFMRQHKKIGALNPLLFHPDKTLQKHYFGDFQSFYSIISRRPKRESVEKNKKFFYRQRISGAALMIKKNLFIEVGGFDEKYFMYFEDEDLCRRLKTKNKKNAILTTAKIIHLEGRSGEKNKIKKFYYQSQNYYWRKHKGILSETMMRIIRFPYLIWQKMKN